MVIFDNQCDGATLNPTFTVTLISDETILTLRSGSGLVSNEVVK